MIKKEYEVILQFVKEPWKKLTFKEVKKISGKKPESYIYNSLKKFVKNEVLKEEKAGNVTLYYLNLKSVKARVYAGFIAEHTAWSKKYLPFDVTNSIINKIPTPYFTFIITGSYAKNKQTEKSDLDLVIIVDDRQDTKHIYAQIRYACEMSIPQTHPYVFKKSEFLEMLLNNEANYGKEIAKNNLIFHGAQEYYSMLNEAVEHGFNDKKLFG